MQGAGVTPSKSAAELSPLELAKQKDLQKVLAGKPDVDWDVLSRFFCQHFKVSDPSKIVPFGNLLDAWSLVKTVTLGFEVGSVIKEQGGKPAAFVIDLPVDGDTKPDCEAQKFSFPLDHTSPYCLFMNDPQPPVIERFVHPRTKEPMPIDLSKISCYSIITRHIWSTTHVPLATRVNFYHKAVNEMQQQEFQDTLMAEGGGIKGNYMEITRTPKEGLNVEKVPLAKMGFGPCNSFFTQSMALVDDSNIENGIGIIPREVCIEARLPVYRGAPDTTESFLIRQMENMGLHDNQDSRKQIKDKFLSDWDKVAVPGMRIDHFKYIPINHIMAWPLASEDYATQRGFRCEQYRFVPKDSKEPVVLFFLISDIHYQKLLADFRKNWMGKVDVRPLSSISVDFVPILDKERWQNKDAGLVPGAKVGCVAACRSYMQYAAPPVGITPEIIRWLAPTRVPEFPYAHEWSVDADMHQQMVQEAAMKGMMASANKKK